VRVEGARGEGSPACRAVRADDLEGRVVVAELRAPRVAREEGKVGIKSMITLSVSASRSDRNFKRTMKQMSWLGLIGLGGLLVGCASPPVISGDVPTGSSAVKPPPLPGSSAGITVTPSTSPADFQKLVATNAPRWGVGRKDPFALTLAELDFDHAQDSSESSPRTVDFTAASKSSRKKWWRRELSLNLTEGCRALSSAIPFSRLSIWAMGGLPASLGRE